MKWNEITYLNGKNKSLKEFYLFLLNAVFPTPKTRRWVIVILYKKYQTVSMRAHFSCAHTCGCGNLCAIAITHFWASSSVSQPYLLIAHIIEKIILFVMNVSNYNLIHSASLLFCNTFLSIYLLSHTLFWKINKKTELENTNQSQTLHTQCILYLDEKKEKKKEIW